MVGIPYAITVIEGNFFHEIMMPLFRGATITRFFLILDTVLGSFFSEVVALMTSIYIGWVLDINTVVKHIEDGTEGFNKPFLGVMPSKLFVVFLSTLLL